MSGRLCILPILEPHYCWALQYKINPNSRAQRTREHPSYTRENQWKGNPPQPASLIIFSVTFLRTRIHCYINGHLGMRSKYWNTTYHKRKRLDMGDKKTLTKTRKTSSSRIKLLYDERERKRERKWETELEESVITQKNDLNLFPNVYNYFTSDREFNWSLIKNLISSSLWLLLEDLYFLSESSFGLFQAKQFSGKNTLTAVTNVTVIIFLTCKSPATYCHIN